VDRKRVDASLQFVGQRSIYHAVALDPALPYECIRHDIEPEMSLTARPVAGVTFVEM
jgi:hypothetical protein